MHSSGIAGPVESTAKEGAIDAAIVLGAALRPDGTPSPALDRRVRHAVALAAAGRVGHLLMSGGPVAHSRPEAAAMRDLALVLGVDAARLAVEERSRNTIENAVYALAVARDRGWRRLAVVTDLYHLPRALYVFRRLRAHPAGWAVPPPTPPGRDWWLACLREVGALPWTVARIERRRLGGRI
jgi:uncharacterized SAM-binding protein YcdF (DUF218 family)